MSDPAHPVVAPPARNGGQILVDALRIQGVDRVFCVPGESYLDVLDALCDAPEIDVVVAKHEGAAANMAEADGKLTGRPGICMVTRGPGATHASIGVHTAFQDSTPMILFIGQIDRAFRDRGGFQEVDYRAMFGPLAKWAAEIDDPSRIPEYVLRAFQVATSGRPGPVVLSLPEDMLAATAAVLQPSRFQPVQSAPSASQMSRVEAALATARRPMLLVGGSCWTPEAVRDLGAFAGAFDLPVAASFRRQDLFDNERLQYAGHLTLGTSPALARHVQESDLLLVVGSRLGEVATSGYELLQSVRTGQTLVHIHPDPDELSSVFQADVPICAGMAEAAAALAALTAPAGRPWGERTRVMHDEFLAFTDLSAAPKPPRGVYMAAAIKHLADTLPDDAVVTNGAGNFTVWVHRFYRYRRPHTELAPTSGAMGYGFPAALAAKLRDPARTVICVAGDGDFLMYPQELATARQFGANLVVLVVNNGLYGTIRMHQARRFPGRVSATRIEGADFVALARSFGAQAERVDNTENFAPALQRALSAGRPALIELIVDPDQITPTLRLTDGAAEAAKGQGGERP
jgi:acetolactate synthase I/II/III large subunit